MEKKKSKKGYLVPEHIKRYIYLEQFYDPLRRADKVMILVR